MRSGVMFSKQSVGTGKQIEVCHFPVADHRAEFLILKNDNDNVGKIRHKRQGNGVGG